ncbi:MAG: hypothetical protein K8R88_10300 [Armatimonadetes bacterium]|nr:hypothetical protein [Armatimonadota bacterium]
MANSRRLCNYVLVLMGSVALVGWVNSGSTMGDIERFVRARDAAGLRKMSSLELANDKSAFSFLNTGGMYGGGRDGWTPKLLIDPVDQKQYVVLGAKLGGEDIGEQVFELTDKKLVRKISESEDFGVKLTHHDFDIRFDIPAKKVAVTDRITLTPDATPQNSFQFRLGSHFVIASIEDAAGKSVPFRQVSGVVSVARPQTKTKYTLKYFGILNLPVIGGMIRDDEASLAGDLWYPMIARNPATHTATIHAPAGWKTIAQGSEVAPSKFQMNLPTCYFSISTGKYRSESIQDNGITIRTLSAKLTQDQMRTQNEFAKPIFRTLKTFAPYPFKSFTFLESRCMFGGALEAYSHATYPENWLPAEEPHEPAHSWFGGILPNTYLNSLWNESFATWFETYYLREGSLCKRSEARRTFIADARPLSSFNDLTCAEANCERGSSASDIGYQKGGFVLQMLEFVIGPEKLKEAIQDMIRAHKPGDSTDWPDFEAAVNRTAQQDMKWFFDQWLRRKGSPQFSVSKVRWENGEVRGLTQFVGEPYRMPVDVIVEYPDGKRELKTTTLGEGTEFKFACPKKPKVVSIDPFCKLLRDYGTNDLPATVEGIAKSLKRYSPNDTVSMSNDIFGKLQAQNYLATLPKEATGIAIFDNPERNPHAKKLCAKAGITVSGGKATYDGTTINLKQGGFAAMVADGAGKWSVVGYGNVKVTPIFGRAKVCLFDQYGRVLRAKTEPLMSGRLAFNIS